MHDFKDFDVTSCNTYGSAPKEIVFTGDVTWFYGHGDGVLHRTVPYTSVTNCRNCGAPVKGHICEYCNTQR